MKMNKLVLTSLLALTAACEQSPTRISSLADDPGAGGSSGGAGQRGEGPVWGTGGTISTSDGAPPPGTCVTETAEARSSPLDIALLVDTSFSMDFELRWQYVKGALLGFLERGNEGDLGLALQFFPQRAQCSTAAYARPAVAMADVATVRADVTSALQGRRMSGGTPIVQALQGLGTYVTGWATAHPDRRPVIVVATDGMPDDTCSARSLSPPNDLDNAVFVARDLAGGTPPIPVFVIGVGQELDALHRIAEAGGTERATLVADGARAQSSFLEALEAIRRQSLACDYLIPTPSSGVIDHERVNVRYGEGQRDPVDFAYVGAVSECARAPDAGWYYDDPATPGRVVLCPETCSRVSGTPTARLDVAYGCQRNDVIIR